MKHVFVTYGDYQGRMLALDDAVADAAVADGWAQALDATGYPYSALPPEEAGPPLTEAPQSYTDWYASLAVPPPEGEAAPESERKSRRSR
jgi:hypothetical protein